MRRSLGHSLVLILGLAVLFGCAAPAPTATPTRPPAAATPTQAGPTPTKAPTATPTKRPITKMTITYSEISTTNMAGWVARSLDYYRDEGLDIDWVSTGGGAKALAAVVGGSAEATYPAAGEVLAAIAQGQPIQAIGSFMLGGSQTLTFRKDVAAAKGITAKTPMAEVVQALRGLTIASSSPGSGNDYAIRFLLMTQGLDPDRDVQIIYVGSGAPSLAALKANQAEAMINTQPTTSQAETEGIGINTVSYPRGDIPEAKEMIYGTITTRKDLIASNPDMLEALARAVWRAAKLMKDRPDEGREAANRLFSETDPAIFKLLWSSYLPAWTEGPPMVTERMFQQALNFRNKASKELPISLTFEQFATNRFMEAAKKQLGY